MRALVVYESMFGNTREVALAIGDGLSATMDVDVVEVGDAALTAVVDLLVVGGPTHAFGMSRVSTRRDAAQQAHGQVVSGGVGVREWLETLSGPGADVAAAAFDTRTARPRVPGSAARAMHRRLERRGFDLVAPAESFWVTGTRGPLTSDETARARRWAVNLSETVRGWERPDRGTDGRSVARGR